jgi:hypothetical protein
MIVTTNNLADIHDRFGAFHDGKIVNMLMLTGNKPLTNMPWEEKCDFTDDKESNINSVSYVSLSKPQIRMSILYNLYDWPNQPAKRQINLIFSGVEAVYPDIIRAIGEYIFDLAFSVEGGLIVVRWAYHDPGLAIRSMDNAIIYKIITCNRIRIQESIFSK